MWPMVKPLLFDQNRRKCGSIFTAGTSLIRLVWPIKWYRYVRILDFGIFTVLLLNCLHQLVQLTDLLVCLSSACRY